MEKWNIYEGFWERVEEGGMGALETPIIYYWTDYFPPSNNIVFTKLLNFAIIVLLSMNDNLEQNK